jgi:hypothetical protein
MKTEEEINKILSNFRLILKRDFYTVKQLLALGIYGCKSSAHRDIKKGLIESAFTTDRRLVVFTDSLLKRIEETIRGKNETMRT